MTAEQSGMKVGPSLKAGISKKERRTWVQIQPGASIIGCEMGTGPVVQKRER